jgi:hypothetical protein
MMNREQAATTLEEIAALCETQGIRAGAQGLRFNANRVRLGVNLGIVEKSLDGFAQSAATDESYAAMMMAIEAVRDAR